MTEKTFFNNNCVIEEQINKLPNRSLFFGEGVFETFRYKSRLPSYFNRHMDRLISGCEYLGMSFPNSQVISKFILGCVAKAQIDDAHVKICLFSSGSSIYSGYPSDYILASVIKEYEPRNHEMTVCLSEETKNSGSPLCLYKTTNYLQNVLARKKAIKKGFNEALFLNEKGYVTECTVYNIFWIKDNKIFTPAIKNGLLPGITRGIVIEICHDLAIEVKEGDFKIDNLQNSDCIFLTNAISGIIRVSGFEGYKSVRGVQLFDEIKYNLLTRLKWN